MVNLFKSFSQFFTVAVLLLLSVNILTTTTEAADSFSSGVNEIGYWRLLGNASATPADYVVSDDQDFLLMESEVSRRLLASRNPGISYPTVGNDGPFCRPSGTYANCPSLRVGPDTRKCDVEIRCSHHP